VINLPYIDKGILTMTIEGQIISRCSSESSSETGEILRASKRKQFHPVRSIKKSEGNGTNLILLNFCQTFATFSDKGALPEKRDPHPSDSEDSGDIPLSPLMANPPSKPPYFPF